MLVVILAGCRVGYEWRGSIGGHQVCEGGVCGLLSCILRASDLCT